MSFWNQIGSSLSLVPGPNPLLAVKGAETGVQAGKTAYGVGKTVVQGATTTADAVSYVVNNAKYAAIWAGLFVLGLVLIVKGLGVSTPSPSKIVPVPVP